MVKTAEFGQPCAAVPVAGKCRICGCTDATIHAARAARPSATCRWADETRTLCNALSCIDAAKREIGR